MSARRSILNKLEDGRYQARVWDDNRTPKPGYTSKRFSKRAEAQEWIRTMERSLGNGLRTENTYNRPTVAAMCSKYLERNGRRRDGSGWARNTAERKAREVRLHVEPYAIAHKRVDELLVSHVEEWMEELREGGLAAEATNMVRGLLCSALDVAHRDGKMTHNPARLAARATGPRRTAEEAATVAMPMSVFHDLVEALAPHFRTAALLSFGLGLRAGEVLGLKLSDVNFLKREVTVRRQLHRDGTTGEPKHGSYRTIPVDATLLDTINAHMARFPLAEGAEDFIVRGPLSGTAVPYSRWSEAFANAVTVGLGLPAGTWTTHDLRHAFGSYQLAAGHRETRVAAWMGHSSLATFLKVYAHDLDMEDEVTPVADLVAVIKARRVAVAS